MSQCFNRRSFLQIAGVSAAAVAAGISAPANAQSSSLSSSLSSHPGSAGGEDLFGLGVAAGSPRHDSMTYGPASPRTRLPMTATAA